MLHLGTDSLPREPAWPCSGEAGGVELTRDSELMIPATQVPPRVVSIPRRWPTPRPRGCLVAEGEAALPQGPGEGRGRHQSLEERLTSLPGQRSLMGLQTPPFLCLPVSPATKYAWGHLYDPYGLSPHPVPQDRFHYSGPNSATYLKPFTSPSCAFVSSH